ncbi:MAG: histidine--tRNA ligase [Oscillospiraceae bacterium]|jgi:histidyl-tRNA synthetase|nr:histidine--tRNA ligase [Oscillospiraceae bacterium]
MPLLTKAVRGTRDVLPQEAYLYRYLENTALETARNFGYAELRLPVFEHTELFERGVGGTTDVVQKEMYTFFDKSGRSITLRPEGTAGAARACLEHGLLAEALPRKVCYALNCYRYEKPQAGRYREFRQFGVECFGAAAPSADAELIALAAELFSAIGLEHYRIELNSIGCPGCRKVYLESLREYFQQHQDTLCGTCNERLAKNPMRILDCKSPVCASVAANAPKVVDYLCPDCQSHFSAVQRLLDAMGIPFTLNPLIVRGLDYYTRTVFEFISESPELEGLTLGAGGRYDGLIEELGGQYTPSLGWAMGLERVLLQLKTGNAPLPEQEPCVLFIASRGEDAATVTMQLVNALRAEGLHVQSDIAGRSLKAQMKFADKIGAQYTMVLGEEELQTRRANLKNMSSGVEEAVSLDDLAEWVEQKIIQTMQEDLQAYFNE